MKTYTDIVQTIKENEYSEGGGFGLHGGDSHGNSAIGDAGVYRIESPAQLKRLNAFIAEFTRKEFLNPRSAVDMLRAKLNIAGLDFTFDNSVQLTSESTTSFKVYRFGGTFGKSIDTPFDEFDNTDGFPDGKSYALEMKLVDVPNGLYKIEATLNEVKDNHSFDVDKKQIKNSEVLHPGKSDEKDQNTMESFTHYKK